MLIAVTDIFTAWFEEIFTRAILSAQAVSRYRLTGYQGSEKEANF